MDSASALYRQVKAQTHELLRQVEARADSPAGQQQPTPAAPPPPAPMESLLLQSSRELARAMGSIGEVEELRATVTALRSDNEKKGQQLQESGARIAAATKDLAAMRRLNVALQSENRELKKKAQEQQAISRRSQHAMAAAMQVDHKRTREQFYRQRSQQLESQVQSLKLQLAQAKMPTKRTVQVQSSRDTGSTSMHRRRHSRGPM